MSVYAADAAQLDVDVMMMVCHMVVDVDGRKNNVKIVCYVFHPWNEKRKRKERKRKRAWVGYEKDNEKN